MITLSNNRIIGYKRKKNELLNILTPHAIRIDNSKIRRLEGKKKKSSYI